MVIFPKVYMPLGILNQQKKLHTKSLISKSTFIHIKNLSNFKIMAKRLVER